MSKTIEEKLEIIRAFLEGEEIEYFYKGKWATTRTPIWDWSSFHYRVKIKAARINWSHVSKEYNFLFFGHYSSWRLSSKLPDKISQAMVDEKRFASAFRSVTKTILADSFTSFVPGDTSLIVRRPD